MNRYTQSEALLARALESIPLGSQTFSKSLIQFPLHVSPYFITKGEGARVWDVDGNEYIDFVNGLLAVNLGYQDQDVDQAVMAQMKNGVTFSLAHPLEVELAELIKNMVPCAEMVRFGKNGSDVTAGAVRVARAYTGREHVAVCGYHGWQDWYIGSTTRNLGVPESTKQLTHRFVYNDIESLEQLFVLYPDKIAAVIMEPMNVSFPENNFLQQVKEIAHKNGAILIFDEMITGFRFANGGAQEYFNVVPDLATFGKGMANGYPISALVGSAKIMKTVEDIFFSFTFGGETLSIAAAIAVLKKLNREPVINTIIARGEQLMSKTKALISELQLEDILTVAGHPTWSFIIFKEGRVQDIWPLKSLWLQEIMARGILSIGTHNLSYAHSEQDIDALVDVYREVFSLLKKAVEENSVMKYLRCEPIRPLFTVR